MMILLGYIITKISKNRMVGFERFSG